MAITAEEPHTTHSTQLSLRGDALAYPWRVSAASANVPNTISIW